LLCFVVSFCARAELVITLGGDINFNKTSFKSHSLGFSPSNSFTAEDAIPWSYFTQKVSPLLKGHLNFANIETVISDDNSIKQEEKKFKFRTHPSAIEHLISIGFNFFSLANNHAYDFGPQGFIETLTHIKSLGTHDVYYHGLGTRDELLKPKVFVINGYSIAFAAISIVDPKYRATSSKIGLLDIRSREDYHELIKSFRALKVDLKILSIHFGTEGQVSLDQGQKKYYEYAIDYADIDLIIGHHPHAVRPISRYKNKLIFYSLGNYLMLGSADITKKRGGADWGMFAKLVYSKNDSLSSAQTLIEAVEFQVLTKTHTQVSLLEGDKVQERLKEFAQLGARELGSDALTWKIKKSKGIYCADGFQSASAQEICD
ncbi:MAG: CapA family protein, partial [Bdellovibrionaceae bacterium]|nr:CapA family protein [Pseudobdellovibrionaceae bacterium]